MPIRTHGESGRHITKEYRSLRAAVTRCTNPQIRSYKDYGGRGITVCQRWMNSYEDFLADMGRAPSPKHSLDRIDMNGNYEPGNVRWATKKEQARNTSKNINITYGGETMCLKDWAIKLGLRPMTLYERIAIYGWTIERAFTKEVRIWPSAATRGGTNMNPPPLPLASGNLSREEDDAVCALLKSAGQQLDEAIPADIDGPTLWFSLQACCKALSVHRKSISTLKPLIGRMLIILQDNPSIYQHYGFKTYDSFLSNGLRDLLGIPRSEAYAAARLVKKFPSLTVDQCQTLTYSKLSFVSKFTDETKEDANAWLARAQTHTLDQLKDIAANKGILPREESDFVTLTLVLNKGQRDMWDAFVSDPSIQSYVGSDNPGKILEMMIAETEAEWLSKGMYKAEALRQ